MSSFRRQHYTTVAFANFLGMSKFGRLTDRCQAYDSNHWTLVWVRQTLKPLMQKECPHMDSRNDQSTMPSEMRRRHWCCRTVPNGSQQVKPHRACPTMTPSMIGTNLLWDKALHKYPFARRAADPPAHGRKPCPDHNLESAHTVPLARSCGADRQPGLPRGTSIRTVVRGSLSL
jgi:hypothetical protein